jgi:hypothetical protein
MDLRVRSELTGPGVYVLIGPPEEEEGAKSSRIYVGETDVLKDRLDTHQKNKDFWTKVVIFTAKDANLNKAHVRYLESRLLAIAADANRAELDNGASSALPALSEADQADMESFLADMLIIYPVLGLTAFEKAAELTEAAEADELYLVGVDAKAEGRVTSEGLVVFKGALARKDPMPSLKPNDRQLRDSLTAAGVLVVDGDHLRLIADYLFSSPSAAANALLGMPANGRVAWKTSSGVTLKELQEQAIDKG